MALKSIFIIMSVMFKRDVLELDLQKTVIGENVQSRAWRPLVTRLGWAVIIVGPSDWANPSCVRVVIMARNRGSKQWGDWGLHNGSSRSVDASESKGRF